MGLVVEPGTRLLVGSFLVIMGLAACEGPVRQEGFLDLPEVRLDGCFLPEPWRLPVDFYAFWDCDDTLQMRFQFGGRPMAESDGVSLQIRGWKNTLSSLPTQSVSFTLPNPQLHVAVYLFRSCRDAPVVLSAAAGELTIEALERKSRGKIKMHGWFEFIQDSTGDVAAPDAVFNIDGELSLSHPGRDFAWCP